jgi:hypothetical protein
VGIYLDLLSHKWWVRFALVEAKKHRKLKGIIVELDRKIIDYMGVTKWIKKK